MLKMQFLRYACTYNDNFNTCVQCRVAEHGEWAVQHSHTDIDLTGACRHMYTDKVLTQRNSWLDRTSGLSQKTKGPSNSAIAFSFASVTGSFSMPYHT